MGSALISISQERLPFILGRLTSGFDEPGGVPIPLTAECCLPDQFL